MKNFSIEIKWGIIFIISGILWAWLEVVFGLHDVYISQASAVHQFLWNYCSCYLHPCS
jgi:hypothetical protein